VRLKNGSEINLPYAELIFALFPVPNLTGIPGMMAHANPISSVGDALHIRKCVLDWIEEAEFAEAAAERDRLLTFAVAGSGQRACATAVELCQMLRTAEVSYPVRASMAGKFIYMRTPRYHLRISRCNFTRSGIAGWRK
jgi:NADH dehydrogenase FAD-containing subunit